MEYKYSENLRFKIVSKDGVKSTWKFPKSGSCSNDCEQKGWLTIGEEAVLKYSKRTDERFKYYLEFDSGLESDYLSEKEVEILMGEDFIKSLEKANDTYKHVKQPKQPLGVTPKNIFEFMRVQDLCRALQEHSLYEDVDLAIMIKWADELNDRLYGLKGDKLNKEDGSWNNL